MNTSLARAVSEMIAKKYEQQSSADTEVFLVPNGGNSGGHCERRYFKKDMLYKVVFPTPLSSLDHYMNVSVTLYDGDTRRYMTDNGVYPHQNHGSILTIYDEYSVNFCFFKFSRDLECSFFTNLH